MYYKKDLLNYIILYHYHIIKTILGNYKYRNKMNLLLEKIKNKE